MQIKNSFFHYFTKYWNTLSSDVRDCNASDFKSRIKIKLKPKRFKHLAKGSKQGNKLITRLRVNRSFLRDNSFSIGHSEITTCDCHFPRETTSHYMLDCFLYSLERQTLLDQVVQVLPQFMTYTKKSQLEILLYGYNINDADFIHTNITLQYIVQNFILKTKRFEQK
jgi:hypothetical protein